MDGPCHLFFEGVEPALPRATALVRAVPARAPVRIVEHHDFVRWLFDRARLPIEHYRAASLLRRLPACLRALRVQTLPEARRAIESNPGLLQTALNAVLLGVSEFLRDAPVFHAIEREILPRLASRSGRLRVWSAGCSDGQELYSVAIQFAEARLLERTEFIGTDVRADPIRRAQEGYFAETETHALPAPLRKRYFIGHGRQVRVCDALRSAIQWKPADLFCAAEPGPWDLVLCRNLVIYFEPAATLRVWESVIAQLRADAFLVVGKADHVHASLGLRRRFAPGIHQKGATSP